MSNTASDFLEGGLSHDFLGAEEKQVLIGQAKLGDKAAMARLIEHNEKLIYSLAFRAFGSGVTGTSELVDLQQLGRMGFMRAVIKYDPGTGNRLSTYATWWVRQYIYRLGVSEGSVFGISHHDNEIRTRLVRCRIRMELELGREVSIPEVAEAASVSLEVANNLLNMHYTSMDADWDDSFVKDQRVQLTDQEQDPERDGLNAALISHVQRELAKLPGSWQIVMELRYPLDGSDPLSQRQIGKMMKISGSRVAQIEEHVIKLLRERITREA